jgi:ribosome-binding factor A
MESTRQSKIARLIQKEMSDILQKKGTGIFHGSMVTITVVRMSPDLSLAKIYISVFPGAKRAEVLQAINEHVHQLRFELGAKVRNQLRIVPELAFFIDDSLDYVDNINRLLKQ